MQWSPWRALSTDGEISASLLPCQAFQLRYFIQVQADARFVQGPIGMSTWDGRWQWTIHASRALRDADGPGPGDKPRAIFDQTTDCQICLVYYMPVSLGAFGLGGMAGGAGGLTLFTWWFNYAKLRVYTVRPQPVWLLSGVQGGYPIPVPPGEGYWADTPSGPVWVEGDGKGITAWQQVPAEHGWADPSGYPPGETSGDGLPESSGFTNYQVYVNLWYYTQPYRIGLPSGAHLGIPFHNIGAYIGGFVQGNLYSETDLNRPRVDAPRWPVKYANVHIRTLSAGAFDTMVDGAGFTRIAAPALSQLTQLYAADGTHFLPRRAGLTLQDPSIGKAPTNSLLVGGMWRQFGWVVVGSDDDGITWGTPTLVFESDYNDVRMAVARDGTVVAVGQRGGRLHVRTGHDGFTHTADLGPARSVFEIAVEQSSGALVVTDGTSVVHRSHDCGRTWTSAPITA